MKKFLKTVTAGALAATFAVSLTACGKKDEDENVLNVMLGTSVKSLDAQVATDGESFEVIAGFTDGLMQMDANGATVNALAESYTVSDDSKTYTFKIRDAVVGGRYGNHGAGFRVRLAARMRRGERIRVYVFGYRPGKERG